MHAAKAPVEKNKEYEMTIDDLGANGEGVGRIDGFAVFVEGALPGERILVKVVKVTKSYAYGKLLSIIHKSPDTLNLNALISNTVEAASCSTCLMKGSWNIKPSWSEMLWK